MCVCVFVFRCSGPCTFDSTLCKNEGQCVDEPTDAKGFKCVCSSRFHGEYCEKGIDEGM